ncbi:hypothetical protein [Pseudoalteromonas denitrificans]|uniref:Uncharacterized protein n=1 Tax=Pseudoalteromonas denitrificans DSM 6059 TaxID=1123010 RepID=A0A1I1QIL5_9GAMM|nr:hypothetical protein [Pseudoalteromonas denitrificans]SFD19093.1 hypothetical protein SAMN02745724_03816 [Pseudoalteromonas denitrificans DSM 6059]
MKVSRMNKSLKFASIGIMAILSSNVFAGASDWIAQSGDFITLNKSESQVDFFVVYPQLGGGNCGIGISLNRGSSYQKYYEKLLEQITVSNIYYSDSGSNVLEPISVDNSGALFAFDFNIQYYGTIVTITANDGKTFGEIFDSLSSHSSVHALASAVSCEQIQEKK